MKQACHFEAYQLSQQKHKSATIEGWRLCHVDEYVGYRYVENHVDMLIHNIMVDEDIYGQDHPWNIKSLGAPYDTGVIN